MKLTNDPTYLGNVSSVSGGAVTVQLASSVDSGLTVINGKVYSIGQVGSFVHIPQGYQDLFAVVSEVGATDVQHDLTIENNFTGRWMKVQLIGESIGQTFERGVSQFPSIGDAVHLTTEISIAKIYGISKHGFVTIGSLSSAESISAKVGIDALVTRHSAILGSTGAGKSTTVASLVRSITSPDNRNSEYPNARILMLDIHGEYSEALKDVATVFSVEPQNEETKLHVPYWALNFDDLFTFILGSHGAGYGSVLSEKVFELKVESQKMNNFQGVVQNSITVDSPIPFSLKKFWYDLVDFELMTYSNNDKTEPALEEAGDIDKLIAPKYKPHEMGPKPPHKNPNSHNILHTLKSIRSKLVDRRYDFLFRPGPWEPDHDGRVNEDLDSLLTKWIGGNKPLSILDLSGVPSFILEGLIGSILKIVYDSLFWGRDKSEGGKQRPLLIVMEEAHRYLSKGTNSLLAAQTVQKIVKEGRKYGVGAMIISQRPSEVDETILSQCGTIFALRLSNPSDQAHVVGNLPDSLSSLLDVLPVLRVGEAVVVGEATRLPMRCRVSLPQEKYRPQSSDPKVTEKWTSGRVTEGYQRIVASWRAQNPRVFPEEVAFPNRREYNEDPDSGEDS